MENFPYPTLLSIFLPLFLNKQDCLLRTLFPSHRHGVCFLFQPLIRLELEAGLLALHSFWTSFYLPSKTPRSSETHANSPHPLLLYLVQSPKTFHSTLTLRFWHHFMLSFCTTITAITSDFNTQSKRASNTLASQFLDLLIFNNSVFHHIANTPSYSYILHSTVTL